MHFCTNGELHFSRLWNMSIMDDGKYYINYNSMLVRNQRKKWMAICSGKGSLHLTLFTWEKAAMMREAMAQHIIKRTHRAAVRGATDALSPQMNCFSLLHEGRGATHAAGTVIKNAETRLSLYDGLSLPLAHPPP